MPGLLVIGASDAGISAALRAKEIQPDAEVTVVSADDYPNFSICGLPFWIGNEVKNWRDLAHRTIDDIESAGIRLLLNHRAEHIKVSEKQVVLKGPGSEEIQQPYDRLIIATGADPKAPEIAGITAPNVFPMRFMADAFSMDRFIKEKRPTSAIILGGGYIGLEMAEALVHRNIRTTLVEAAPAVLPTLNPVMGTQVEKTLAAHGVKVISSRLIRAISVGKNGGLIAEADKDLRVAADMILAATGVIPSVSLAASAGIELAQSGAIAVNRRMEINIADIYAAGDCAQTWHRMLNRHIYLPLGTTAHKQGRIAGENAVGGNKEFQGILGTQVVKVFDRVAARTGLKDSEAAAEGFEPLSIQICLPDHKPYYPVAQPMDILLTADKPTHRLLGAQIVGAYGTEISKRIDIFAAALFSELTVDAFIDLDLSYTPPLSAPWDPVQAAAMKWLATA